MSRDPQQLKFDYHVLKKEQPDVRARNAAEILGVSEGELVASFVGDAATRLMDDHATVLKNLLPLGEVMALTRNASCVHERKGIYDNASFSQHGNMSMGLFVNVDIDLRLFMNHWKYGFALTEKTAGEPKRSLQFFDQEGVAVHKIYLTPKSDVDFYEKIVTEYRHKKQENTLEIKLYEPQKSERSDSEIDWVGFRLAWENLQDTHDFFPLLAKFGVGRQQAFRHIGQDFAYEVDDTATRQILSLARDKNCEIMVFVGNRGCLQIHTGPVKNLASHGPWYNVLDPQFNLHLREDHIGRSWVTKKPTADGIVTALEVFSTEGEVIATFFGKRKPGIPELELWREIISLIPSKKSSDENILLQNNSINNLL